MMNTIGVIVDRKRNRIVLRTPNKCYRFKHVHIGHPKVAWIRTVDGFYSVLGSKELIQKIMADSSVSVEILNDYSYRPRTSLEILYYPPQDETGLFLIRFPNVRI